MTATWAGWPPWNGRMAGSAPGAGSSSSPTPETAANASLREEGEEHYDLLAYDFADNGDLVVHSEPTDAFARAVEAGAAARRGSQGRGMIRRWCWPARPTPWSPSWRRRPRAISSRGTAFVLKKLPGPGGAE